jgi:hypothetical protein
LTYRKYIDLAKAYGMNGVAFATKDYESNIYNISKIHRGMAKGKALEAFAEVTQLNQTNAPEFCQAFLQELQEASGGGVPDVCLSMPFTQYVA